MAAFTRRRLIGLAAIASGGVAAGGGAFLWSQSRGRARYDDAVGAIWRHSGRFDLSADAAQRQLVRYGTLAASSHNTQPWVFRLGDGAISIRPDPARRCPVVDPDDHHLYASLGCAAENIVQAAPAFGLKAAPTFDAADSGSAHVALEQGARQQTQMFEAIPHRQCTRAAYAGRPLTPLQRRALLSASRGPAVQVLLFTEPSQIENILAYLIEGNTAQMNDRAFVAELKAWIRFGYSDALATGDGLFSLSSGNPVLPTLLGRMLFDVVFSLDAENEKLVRQVRSSAGIAVIVSDADDRPHWFAAGRCYQRFALQATALGLRHAFLNQPVEVPGLRGQFASHLGIGNRRPDLVLRVGLGPAMPRSLRRPLAEVLR